MIYTLTLNPALDYHIRTDVLRPGEVNRTDGAQFVAGGKGLNVSTVLHHLGIPTTALGFLAGFTGDILAALTAQAGIPAEFLTLPEGNSRLNVKLHAREDTELNAAGAAVSPASMAQLYDRLEQLAEGDTLVLAGSLPPGLPDTVYREIMERLGSRVRFAVDATGELLRQTIAMHPFLIKPNHLELGELFGVRLNTPGEAERYARRLQDMGARHVLVSMGARGALLLAEDGKAYFRRALQGKAVNTTGAGDSMLAGFLAGWERYHDPQTALLFGVAAASVSVFTGSLADREQTEALFEQLRSAMEE